MTTPNLKSLVDMAIDNLTAIREAIGDANKPLPPQVAKKARKSKAFALMIIEEVNDIRKAVTLSATKKK